MRSNLHPAVQLVDDLLHSQAGWDTERDTAAEARLNAGLQQRRTGPGRSESQLQQHTRMQMKYYNYNNTVN